MRRLLAALGLFWTFPFLAWADHHGKAEDKSIFDGKTLAGWHVNKGEEKLKVDGEKAAKARLVALGFQAPNIAEVQTASPTLA